MNILFSLIIIGSRSVRFLDKHLSLIYVYFECRRKALRFNKKLHDRFKLSRADVRNYKKRWRIFNNRVASVYLSNIASIFRKVDFNVVPANVYYSYIEPALNNIPYVTGLEDKSLLDWIYHEHTPGVLLRNIHGIFYVDGNGVKNEQVDLSVILEQHPKVLVKQSVESHGGRNIQIFERTNQHYCNINGDNLTLNYLLSNFKSNFVIQTYVRQHPFFLQFNPSSLNTLRVMTYRSVTDNQIKVLNVTLRVGAPGSIVDNRKYGGHAVGVTPEGYLRSFGVNNKGGIVHEFNGIKLKGIERVAGIDEIKKVAVESAKIHYHARVLGFDMSYTDQNEVKIIEVNTWDLGIDNIQQANGALFHQYTDEVIAFCKKRVKT
ncbi:sugar-transfer associated ATP-grasp domain-containing protein [Carboxylicivirga sp. RSCT41]|uniref:sugar-transfer associated ATP-grasp domain-containing protein n=1 Tax=Carboxylicivirga agarovorans TaxID=3417570 RepID=UPI003D3259F3